MGNGTIPRDRVVFQDQYDEVHEVAKAFGDEMLLSKQGGVLGHFSHGKGPVVVRCISVMV